MGISKWRNLRDKLLARQRDIDSLRKVNARLKEELEVTQAMLLLATDPNPTGDFHANYKVQEAIRRWHIGAVPLWRVPATTLAAMIVTEFKVDDSKSPLYRISVNRNDTCHLGSHILTYK